MEVHMRTNKWIYKTKKSHLNWIEALSLYAYS